VDNQNQNPGNLSQANTPPASPSSQTPHNPSLEPGKPRVIQPSAAFIKEMAETPSDPKPSPTQVTPQNNDQLSSATNQTQSLPPSPSPYSASSIYPTSVSDPYSNPGVAALKSESANSSEPLSFADGYSIGKSIFWNLVIADFIAGIIFYTILVTLLQSSAYALALVFVLFEYCTFIFLSIYMPYRVLNSSDFEPALWISLFGASIQSIMASFVGLIYYGLGKALINNKNASLLRPFNNETSYIIFLIILIPVVIAISFYITRLAYGFTFYIFGKINDYKKIKLISIALTALVVVVAISIGVSDSHRAKSEAISAPTTSNTQSLKSYNVTEGAVIYTVNFYKGAVVSDMKGNAYLVSKNALGSKTEMFVLPISQPLSYGSDPTFSYTSENGQTEIATYDDGGQLYASDVEFYGQNYQVNIASQSGISISQARAILSSINIQ
jgi:hypothetical protein